MIAPASAAHAGVLAMLHAAAFDHPWTEAEFAQLLSSPGVAALIDSEADQPDGFVLWRVAADEAEILTIAVAPAARRRGLGGGLLDAALKAAIRAGADAMLLEVAVDNRAALALYQSRGFAQVGKRPRYYRTPAGYVDAAILRLMLNSVGGQG